MDTPQSRASCLNVCLLLCSWTYRSLSGHSLRAVRSIAWHFLTSTAPHPVPPLLNFPSPSAHLEGNFLKGKASSLESYRPCILCDRDHNLRGRQTGLTYSSSLHVYCTQNQVAWIGLVLVGKQSRAFKKEHLKESHSIRLHLLCTACSVTTHLCLFLVWMHILLLRVSF